jgi:hypothetical protein
MTCSQPKVKKKASGELHFVIRSLRKCVRATTVEPSCIVCAWESASICIGSTCSLYSCCLLLGGLAVCDDEVHVCVDGEADDFLVERFGEAAGLEVEAEERLGEMLVRESAENHRKCRLF